LQQKIYFLEYTLFSHLPITITSHKINLFADIQPNNTMKEGMKSEGEDYGFFVEDLDMPDYEEQIQLHRDVPTQGNVPEQGVVPEPRVVTEQRIVPQQSMVKETRVVQDQTIVPDQRVVPQPVPKSFSNVVENRDLIRGEGVQESEKATNFHPIKGTV
jgi:hypothetical protein